MMQFRLDPRGPSPMQGQLDPTVLKAHLDLRVRTAHLVPPNRSDQLDRSVQLLRSDLPDHSVRSDHPHRLVRQAHSDRQDHPVRSARYQLLRRLARRLHRGRLGQRFPPRRRLRLAHLVRRYHPARHRHFQDPLYRRGLPRRLLLRIRRRGHRFRWLWLHCSTCNLRIDQRDELRLAR